MSKGTAIKAAIANFEKERSVVAAESSKVDLSAQVPPIEKLDATLNVLKACKHLTLSTNNIEKVANLASLTNLEVLSLARNQIKKLEGFDPLAETLQELWISYNLLEKLAGLEKLGALRVLYLSNNKVKDWPEVERLAACGALAELVLMGNPLVPAPGTDDYRYEVLRRLPGLKKLDGMQVTQEERDAARDGTGPPRPASAGMAVRSSMIRSSMIKQS